MSTLASSAIAVSCWSSVVPLTSADLATVVVTFLVTVARIPTMPVPHTKSPRGPRFAAVTVTTPSAGDAVTGQKIWLLMAAETFAAIVVGESPFATDTYVDSPMHVILMVVASLALVANVHVKFVAAAPPPSGTAMIWIEALGLTATKQRY